MKKKLVVLTGAGMSAESGISTFRDSDGLWEKYRVEDVATPEGFAADPELVRNLMPDISDLPTWNKNSTSISLRKTSTTCTNGREAAM